MNDFIEDAITAAKLAMQVDPKHTDVYACKITSRHGEMVREIRMKPGFDVPTLGAVIHHYAVIAQLISEYDDVLEWVKDTGHDLNDPATIPKFTQLVDDERNFQLLLGQEVFEKIMTGLAISQAIVNARPR